MPATQVKVEVRFNGTDWVDVSGRCLLPSGVAIQRGRDSETGDAAPVGTCSLTLSNDDGRFSPEMASSPYYPYVTDGVALKVSAWANGAWRPRFYGTVQSWSVGWLADDEGGRLSVCRVTANDTLGSLPSYVFRQPSDEVVRAASGVEAHWPLRDSSSPAQPMIGSQPLTDNGGSGWGEGGLLPLDEGTTNHPLMKSQSGGLTLTTPFMGIPAPWSVSIVILTQPTANATILNLGGGVTLRWQSGAFTVLPEDVIVTPPGFPALLTVSAAAGGGVNVLCETATDFDANTGYATLPPTLGKVVVNPTLSGGSQWQAGHLVVYRGASSTPQALVALRSSLSHIQWLWRLMTGDTAGLLGADDVEGMLPAVEGRDAADVIAAVVKGMGARLVDNLDGTLTWVPFDDATTPVTLPEGEVDHSLTWQTDTTGWRSDATVSWADGTSYTASRPDGKRQSESIEGVHATREQDRSYADWLVWSPTRARLPQVPFDLSTLSEAHRATLAGVTVGSRVTLTGLPTQMPSTLTCIVEGVEETLTHQDWDLTLKLSPDVVSRLFVLDDATRGVLDGPYLLAP